MTTATKTLNVAVVSHACVVDVNQEPFRALAGRGLDVHVFAPRELKTDIRGTIEFSALEGVVSTPLGVRLGGFRRGLGQGGVHLIVYSSLERALSRAKPDVLYVEEEPYSLAALQVSRIARRLGVPFAFHQSQNLDKRLPPPFEAVRSRVLRRAAGATARIGSPASLLRNRGFAGEICEIPNVVDPARFEAAPRYLGLERPVFGFVGRLVAPKGILEFVRAAASARDRIGRGSILVAGAGPLEQDARALAATVDLPATFAGAVEHAYIGGVYRSIDVLAVPSRASKGWTEQFGRVVVEAGAAGVPVVVSECGELPATARATGGGVVVGDEAALTDALARLGADEAERDGLGSVGKKNVHERFTPEAVAAQLEDFFTRLEVR